MTNYDAFETEEVIRELVSYAWPGRDRGPAHPDWIALMKKTANLMGWDVCTKCNGKGEVPVKSDYRSKDCCPRCYAIGKVDEDE